jgi:hypothetical protein
MGLAKSFKKKRERIEEARKKKEKEKASYPVDTTFRDLTDPKNEDTSDNYGNKRNAFLITPRQFMKTKYI